VTTSGVPFDGYGLKAQQLLRRWTWISNPWKPTGAFDLVGSAYLDGYMEGLALDEVDSGKRKLEDIIFG
jgi:hypothetical protein